MELLILIGVFYALYRMSSASKKKEETSEESTFIPIPSESESQFRQAVDQAPDWATLKRLWYAFKDKIPWLIALVAFLYTSWRAIEHELGVAEAKKRTEEFEDRVLGPSWSKWSFETKKNMLYNYPGGLQKFLRLEGVDEEGQYAYTLFPHRVVFRKLIEKYDEKYGTLQTSYPTVGSKEGWRVN